MEETQLKSMPSVLLANKTGRVDFELGESLLGIRWREADKMDICYGKEDALHVYIVGARVKSIGWDIF